MLKVECESCKAPYQVDERRVSASGLKMRCPKCGHTFLVTDPSKGAPPAAGATHAIPKPSAKGKATIVGLAPKVPPTPRTRTVAGVADAFAPTSPAPAAPFAPTAPAPAASATPDLDFDLPLPVTKGAPGARGAGAGAVKAAPGAPAFPSLDDLDLPAVAGDAGLPAAVPRGAKPVIAKAKVAPPAAKPAPQGKPAPLSFDVDLPAVGGPALPATKGFGDIDLPASKGADLPSAKGFGDLPAAKAKPAAKPAPAPKGFGDIDLPASKGGAFGDLDLPATKGGGFGDIDLPATKGGGGPFGDLDLPAAKGGGFGDLDLPAAKGGGFGDIDLPSAKGGGFGDLPSAKGGGFGDLPSAKGGGFGDLPMPRAHTGHTDVDLPLVHRGGPSPAARGAGGGFGEIDLPSVQNDLPMHSGNANLPSPVGANAHLPSPAGPHAHLPSPAGPHAHLPTVMGAGAHLPSPTGLSAHLPSPAGTHLPTVMGVGAHLPSPTNPNAHLPSALGLGPQLPSLTPDDRHLPVNRPSGALSFGELDLPLVESAQPPPPALGGGFGEVDLPADPIPSGAPPLVSAPPPDLGGGGLGFGEVDLGGGASDSVAPLGPPPATSAGSFAFQEASLDDGGGNVAPAAGGPAIGTRAQKPAAPQGKSSSAPKILGLIIGLVVAGGAGLQLTPLGAFGHVWLSDKIHAGDYFNDATSRADAARKKLALDTFVVSSEAADELIEARRRAPRSRPLGAYAAFVEYTKQVRFGGDPQRAAKVNTFITDVPPDTEVPYLLAAQAAQSASAGEWDKARGDLERAVTAEPKNGIQHELSILKGEIALAQHDHATALGAFSAAHASEGSARTSFGIARAHFMANALPKARQAVDDTLKASPNHAGALTMRAELVWQMQRDDGAAMKDLAVVLDPKNKGTLGLGELSNALAAKGWIMFARDRAGEARAAFDEAVKVDPKNVTALVGQGEVLYADGRNTEALTRFDDAISKDATNIEAILGSAKAKIALERLADAKTQLTAARQKAPKNMNVALWLARTEEALGNKKAAEELFGAAIDLADPQDPEAVQAYAATARFLAGQGKNVEAGAKLEQARAKLPDTAALQRAFGEVAAAQGHYDEALEHFDAALKKNPGDLGTRFRLGMTYRKLHKLDLAAKALDEVTAVDKEYPGIALERGLLFEESGDPAKALEQFTSASQKAPNDIDLGLRVGAAFVAVGDVDAALPYLLKAKDARPNSAEANHLVGRAYLKQGGLEGASAMRYLQRAVSLDPNRAEYHLYVAWAANDATPAQLGLARTHVEKALALDKLLGDAYWQRGVLNRKEGQVNDAIKDLKRALELKPSRHEAHAALAEAYEERNEMAAATTEWQRAIAGDEKPPYWRFKYGKILADRGQSAEAARHLSYAVEHGKSVQPRPGWLSSAAFEAGEALRKTGQKKDACDEYRLFMELAPSTSPDMRDAAKAQRDLGCPSEAQ